MKIRIAKTFRKNQRGAIRAALMVATHNFPMPPTVTVRAFPREVYDPDLTDEPLDGYAQPREIWLAPCLRDDALFFAASHEARHVSDFWTGKLRSEKVNGRQRIFWNGKPVDMRTAYRALPFEVPAFRYEKKLGFKLKRQ